MSYIKLVYILLISGLCIFDSCVSYKTYTLSDDEICSPIKKRELKIGNHKHSAIVVKEIRTFERWDGYDFRCRFEIEAPSGDGLIAVIQNLYFRMHSNGTCIDFVQFRRRGPKFCGRIRAFQPLPMYVEQVPDLEDPSGLLMPENAYVDVKGEIDTLIYVDSKKLEAGEKLELEIAFTSYRDCSKGRPGYEPCDSRICIWKGLFNDSIVNCPSNCVDENGCFRSPAEKRGSDIATKVTFGAVTTVILAFLLFFTCLWALRRNKKLCWSSSCTDNRPHHVAPSSHLATDTHRNPEEEHVLESVVPTAPPLEHMIPAADDKDLPPPYESLFPSASNTAHQAV